MPARIRASAIHLAISLLVLVPVCGLVFAVWYPAPWFTVMGMWPTLLVLTAVHLCIGPLLTALVYRPGKKGMVFDLWVIGILQTAALAWGSWTMHQQRPAFLVFAVDRFNVLTWNDVDGTAARDADIGMRPARGPAPVYAEMPADPDGHQRLLREVFFEGKSDLERRPAFWRRYEAGREVVLARAQPLATLAAAEPWNRVEVASAIGDTGLPEQRLAWLPAMGKRRDFAVVVDTATGDPVTLIAVNPWPAP